jgi:hypothetical protein
MGSEQYLLDWNEVHKVSIAAAMPEGARDYAHMRLSALSVFFDDEVNPKLLRIMLDFTMAKSLYYNDYIIKNPRFTNFGQMNKDIQGRIPRTQKAQKIINEHDRKIASNMLILEHITPMSALTQMLTSKNVCGLIDAFALAFVSKEDDAMLTKRGGYERYSNNQISLLIPDTRMLRSGDVGRVCDVCQSSGAPPPVS